MSSMTRRHRLPHFRLGIRPIHLVRRRIWGCSPTPFRPVAMSSMTPPVRHPRFRVAANFTRANARHCICSLTTLARPLFDALGDATGAVSRISGSDPTNPPGQMGAFGGVRQHLSTASLASADAMGFVRAHRALGLQPTRCWVSVGVRRALHGARWRDRSGDDRPLGSARLPAG
jgi:hypothetical protein